MDSTSILRPLSSFLGGWTGTEPPGPAEGAEDEGAALSPSPQPSLPPSPRILLPPRPPGPAGLQGRWLERTQKLQAF